MRASKARGVALITVLIMLSMLSALTLLLMMNLLEDARSSSVLERNLQLFYFAEAGIEEMRARLLYGSASQLPNLPTAATANWAGYIKADATVNIGNNNQGLDWPAYSAYNPKSEGTALGTAPYVLVKVFYNTEANKNRDIDEASGPTPCSGTPPDCLNTDTVVYLGPDGSGNLTRNLTGNGSPIRTIQAYATLDGRRELVEAEIVSAFVVLPDIEAVIRNSGNATFTGTAGTNITRTDNGTTLPAIKTVDTSPTGNYAGTVYEGAPPDAVETGASFYDVSSYVTAAADIFPSITDLVAATTTTPTEYEWDSFSTGSDTNPTLMYSDRSVDFDGGTAYGILVVNGDVDISSHEFHGLIIASGNAVLAGGGAAVFHVYGAVIAGGNLTISDGFDAALDLDAINNYLRAIRTKIITFREVRK